MNARDRTQRFSPNSRAMTGVAFVLLALIGAVGALLAFRTNESDPLETMLRSWPMLVVAAVVHGASMCIYSASWAALFAKSENRMLIALSFLISQPAKYLPGGIAQPVGQVALTAQVTRSGKRTVVAFPVHLIVNVVSAVTLTSPILLVLDLPVWSRWTIVLVPLLWVALDRRWMISLLNLLGRLHRAFRVSEDLPEQSRINSAFGLALLAHGLMFLAFGILTADSVADWSVIELALVYGLAWTVGYLALPAPAGLGAREMILALILGGTLSTLDVVKLSAGHRATTLVVEVLLMVSALVFARRALTEKTFAP